MLNRPTLRFSWTRVVTVVGVLIVLLFGIGAAHAARLELTTPSLTSFELSGCGQATVFVRPLDGGDGVVVTGLPESCAAGTLRVEVRSRAGEVVFTGEGPVRSAPGEPNLDARRTTVRGHASPDLRSPADRQALVWVEDWPLAAAWLPSAQDLWAAPITATGGVAVANIGWQIRGTNKFCTFFEVVNANNEPTVWTIEVDLSAAPFHYVDAPSEVPLMVGFGLPTEVSGHTLSIRPPGWRPELPADSATTIEVCDFDAPPPPLQDPGSATYTVSSALVLHRDPTDNLSHICVAMTVADNRPDGLFWIGWYAILDWGGLLDAAVADGRITEAERATFDAKSLTGFWPGEDGPGGGYHATRLPDGHTYRIVGGDPVQLIAPGAVYDIQTCV